MFRTSVRCAGVAFACLAFVGCGPDEDTPPTTVEPAFVFVDDGTSLSCALAADASPPGELPALFTACGVRIEAWSPPIADAGPRIELTPPVRWLAAITDRYAVASDMARVYVVDQQSGERVSTPTPPGQPYSVVAGDGNVVVELPTSLWLASLDGTTLAGRAVYVLAEDQPAELSDYWWRAGSSALAIDATTLVLSVPGGLSWLDIRDPLHPVELACLPQSLDPDSPTTWFVAADALRAVATVVDGVERTTSIYYRDHLDAPVTLSVSRSELEPPAWVEGDRVLVGGTDNIELYDISGESPRLVGAADLPRMSNNYAPPPVGGFVLFPGPYNDETRERAIWAVDLRADGIEIWTGNTPTEVYACSIVLTSPDGTRQVELGQASPALDRIEPVVGLQCPDSGVRANGTVLVAEEAGSALWVDDRGYTLMTYAPDSPFDSPIELSDPVAMEWDVMPVAWTTAGLLHVFASDGGDWSMPSSGALEFRDLGADEPVRIELPGRPINWDINHRVMWLVTEAVPTIYGEPAADPPDWTLGRVELSRVHPLEFEVVEHEGPSTPYAVAVDGEDVVYVLFHDGSLEIRTPDGAPPIRLDSLVGPLTGSSDTAMARTWMLASDDGAWIQGADELVEVTPAGEVRHFGQCDGARLADAANGYVYLAVPHSGGGRATHDLASVVRATPRQLPDGTWAFDVHGRIGVPAARLALSATDRGFMATFGDNAVALGATLTIASW